MPPHKADLGIIEIWACPPKLLSPTTLTQLKTVVSIVKGIVKKCQDQNPLLLIAIEGLNPVRIPVKMNVSQNMKLLLSSHSITEAEVEVTVTIHECLLWRSSRRRTQREPHLHLPICRIYISTKKQFYNKRKLKNIGTSLIEFFFDLDTNMNLMYF